MLRSTPDDPPPRQFGLPAPRCGAVDGLGVLAATASRCWTTSAAAADASFTPGPPHPCRARSGSPRNFGGDRPPVVGVVGRGSGKLRLVIVERSDRAMLEGFVESSTREGTLVCTDECRAYGRLAELGRRHATVTHKPGQREWARDDDGDGSARSTTTRWMGIGRG